MSTCCKTVVPALRTAVKFFPLLRRNSVLDGNATNICHLSTSTRRHSPNRAPVRTVFAFSRLIENGVAPVFYAAFGRLFHGDGDIFVRNVHDERPRPSEHNPFRRHDDSERLARQPFVGRFRARLIRTVLRPLSDNSCRSSYSFLAESFYSERRAARRSSVFTSSTANETDARDTHYPFDNFRLFFPPPGSRLFASNGRLQQARATCSRSR